MALLSNDMVVLQCKVIDNDRLGIGGGGNGVTIVDSVVSDNGLHVDKGWEAGGIKTIADNVLIADDQIDGNGAPGIWTDSGARGPNGRCARFQHSPALEDAW